MLIGLGHFVFYERRDDPNYSKGPSLKRHFKLRFVSGPVMAQFCDCD